MKHIEDHKWAPDSNEVSWVAEGQAMRKTFQGTLGSVTVLQDRSGFLAVENPSANTRGGAAIWNADGSLRCSLRNPYGANADHIFYYGHHVGDRLHVVLAGQSGDFGYFVDEKTCELSGRHEVR